MKIFIRTSSNGDVTIHRNHKPSAKGHVLVVFQNRDGDTVYEYASPTMSGSRYSFIETQLQD